MTDPEIVDYYTSLLALEYRTKTKFGQLISLLAEHMFCDGLPFELLTCFKLDNAVGAQLDVIGRIVGVPRNVYQIDLSHVFFNFGRYSSIPPSGDVFGFGRYTDSPFNPDAALFYRYSQNQNATTYELTDSEMLLLIKMKILLNNSFSSLSVIKSVLYTYFPGLIDVTDNKDMTLTYTLKTSLSRIGQAAESLGLLPRPMGVGITVNYD